MPAFGASLVSVRDGMALQQRHTSVRASGGVGSLISWPVITATRSLIASHCLRDKGSMQGEPYAVSVA